VWARRGGVLVVSFLFCLSGLAHSQEAISIETVLPSQSLSSIEVSLQAINEISMKLDEIANLSEAELEQLVDSLTQARQSLVEASRALSDSERIRLNLEQSLVRSEVTLVKLAKHLRFYQVLAFGETLVIALFLLIIVL